MTVFRRVALGTFANAAGIGMNSVLQLLTMPMLLVAWGQDRFGIWLMLTTIPAYFALSDLGFVQAATTDMTIKHAENDFLAVLRTFQSTFILFLSLFIAVIAASTLIYISLYLNGLLVFYPYSEICMLLVVYSSLSILSRVTLAGFKATGEYALGSLIYDFLTFVEGIISIIIAYWGGSFESVGFTLIFMRLGCMILFYTLLRRRVPWLYYGADHATAGELRRLLAPALAAMAIPMAFAINLQGILLVVGYVLSPASVAIFSPVRTASRLIIQLLGVINRATMPEIGRAAGEGASSTMDKLLRLNFMLIFFILIPGCIIFCFFGQKIVMMWSGGKLEPPASFVAMMALAMAMQGSWNFISNIALAKNEHINLAKLLFISSVISLFLAYPSAKFFGLSGCAAAITIGELMNISIVIWDHRRNAVNSIKEGSLDGRE